MHFVTKNSQFVNCVPNKICHFSLFCINLVNFTELLHCFTELFSNRLGKNADRTQKKTERRKGRSVLEGYACRVCIGVPSFKAYIVPHFVSYAFFENNSEFVPTRLRQIPCPVSDHPRRNTNHFSLDTRSRLEWTAYCRLTFSSVFFVIYNPDFDSKTSSLFVI